MLKLVLLFGSYLVLLNSQGSFGDSQDNNRSVCLLTDPSNQCEQFCLSKLHPLIDLIPKTNIKLRGIQGEQLSTQMKLVAVQSGLEAQRIQIQNFIKMIPTKEDFESGFNGTAGQLMAVNSELKNQLLGLQSKIEDQHTEIQESFKKTSTQEDFEVVLNRTQEQAMLIHLELKNQHLILQKGLEDRMQIQLDEQLGEVRTTLNDQKKALYDYFKSEMEGQLMTVKSEMTNQFKLLQNRLEDHGAALIETNKKAITNEDFIEIKTQLLALQSKLQTLLENQIPLGFEKIGTRYFYIESGLKLGWSEAANKCREMGGYLAAIQDQEELNAISAKLETGTDYWLGINDEKNEGEYVSVLTKKPAPFLKWRAGEPNDYENEEDGVILRNGQMNDASLHWKHFFICQADKKI